MKKSSEVQGLPIISIANGAEIGQAKSLIINPEKRSIDFVTIGHEEWEQEGKAIPFNKIIGIGDYAMTIDHESSVIEMNNIPVANELLNRNTKIVQNRLMTKKGQLIGQAVEYIIDDETGEITQLIVKDQEGTFAVDGQHVVTYGRDLIVVTEDVVKESLEGTLVQEESAAPAPEHEAAISPGVEEQTPVESAEAKLEEASPSEEPLQEEAPSIDRWLRLIDDQQSQLLKGKTTTKDIEFNEEVLIPAGTVLEEEHIEKARSAGPEILVELSMNSGA
ncbi:PRC-barrel domain-containing protein [Domibacillus enclensis]|uniref:Uncharacterized protein YrrD, contains PRC-barrel domain n=1 Tax=Domibacillus enclensis TaxID=1017273 RepID=A0A1N6Q0U4_9BACI|nr:PRC-barrel domain-containing protein [Domibacillus enclensis]OXS80547.1 hypothetical protein B1B05_03440 [Domibacillus enclensis]SIQ10200.1 Uncharacterized protein YrrD, contains PRC-barrel domain [Domibacillus enclensis]